MERIIGFVDGELEVERLESDTEDYYRGLFAGVEAAIEVYGKKPTYNCTFHPLTGSCDKAQPCFGCAAAGIDCEEPTPDYFKGYEVGYDLGIAYITEEAQRRTKRIEDAEKSNVIRVNFGCDEDLLAPVDQEIAEGLQYAKGHSDGYNFGYDLGYEQGVEDVHLDEVVLDSEFLDMVYNLKEDIRHLTISGETAEKLSFEDLRQHNFSVYDCHHALIGIVEWWVMDKVYSYWNRKEKEE
jgi:hypothetical protein